MKKIIRLTESDLVRIVNKVISEQKESSQVMKAKQYYLKKHGYANGIPDFKVDGVYGDATEKAIQNFQAKLGVWPQDGRWGEETFKKMNAGQMKMYKQYVADFGGVIDKFTHSILSSLGLD